MHRCQNDVVNRYNNRRPTGESIRTKLYEITIATITPK